MNIAVMIASFLSGMLGAMGFGAGTVLIIYLTSFLSLPQKEAQGINLIFFLFTGAFALLSNGKKGLINKKEFLHFLPCSLAGLVTGFFILPVVPTALLKKLFGAVLLLIGLKELFSKKKMQSNRR